MSATEFLRSLTADEIRRASDDSDLAEDAVRGGTMSDDAYISRIYERLATDYPGLHKRMHEFVEGSRAKEPDERFIAGVLAGALMMAHDITIAAEVYDAKQSFGNAQS